MQCAGECRSNGSSYPAEGGVARAACKASRRCESLRRGSGRGYSRLGLQITSPSDKMVILRRLLPPSFVRCTCSTQPLQLFQTLLSTLTWHWVSSGRWYIRLLSSCEMDGYVHFYFLSRLIDPALQCATKSHDCEILLLCSLRYQGPLDWSPGRCALLVSHQIPDPKSQTPE